MGLLERVAFHLEGTESRVIRDIAGEPAHIRQTFGPDRWIEPASAGRMTALDFLAVVLFQGYLAEGIDSREVVNGWLNELRRAVKAGEVTPRNRSSLLPCEADFSDLGWVISRTDAIRLLEQNHTGINLDATIAHLLEGTLRNGERQYHPETGEPLREFCKLGYEPKEPKSQPPGRIDPVEQCSMLPDFGRSETEDPKIDAKLHKNFPPESMEERQDRRLSRLRALGGDHNGKGVIGRRGAKAALEREETRDGRQMCRNKEIGKDLKAAVQRERSNPGQQRKPSNPFNL